MPTVSLYFVKLTKLTILLNSKQSGQVHKLIYGNPQHSDQYELRLALF